MEIEADDIVKEFVNSSADMGKDEAVTFELDSLSTVAVSGASMNVNITIPFENASPGYKPATNLYAYLLTADGNNCPGALITINEDGIGRGTFNNVAPGNYELVLAQPIQNPNLGQTENKSNLEGGNLAITYRDGDTFQTFNVSLPESVIVSENNNTIEGAKLTLIPINSGDLLVSNLMDHAINYGIVAEKVEQKSNPRTNYAAIELTKIQNPKETLYQNRYTGTEPIPSIIGTINPNDFNGQQFASDKKEYFYSPVDYKTPDNKPLVNDSKGSNLFVRNKTEIEDKIRLLQDRTLDQCKKLTEMSTINLPALNTIDVTAYPDNTTIAFNADNLNGLDKIITLRKKEGQTVIFTINGEIVNIKQEFDLEVVKADGSVKKKLKSGNEMQNATEEDGDDWSKVIWNLPNAKDVKSSNGIGGILLVPQKGSKVFINSGGGWIVSRGDVEIQNQWYAFPGTDTPFRRGPVKKIFVGVSDINDINKDFKVQIKTSENPYTTSMSEGEIIETLVLPSNNSGKKPTVATDGNSLVLTWVTDELAVGNQHYISEDNAEIEFDVSTGYSKAPTEVTYTTYDMELDTTTHTVTSPHKITVSSSAAANKGKAYNQVKSTFNITDNDPDVNNVAMIENHYSEPQTASFGIYKEDENGKALSGAVFKLIKGNEIVNISTTGNGEVLVNAKDNSEQVEIKDNAFRVPSGGVTISGLGDGNYSIVEVVAPDGYIITNSTPITFSVNAGMIINPVTVTEISSYANGEFTVINTPGEELPYTGGTGTRGIAALGILLMAGSAAVLLIRRRRLC